MFRKIGIKSAIFVMAAIVLIVGIELVLIMRTTDSFTDSMLFNQSKSANDSFAYMLESYQKEAIERAEMIAGSNDVVQAIMSGDTEALLSALENLSTGLDLITLCDAQGTVLARTHSDKKGDSVISQQAISTALSTGKGISTIEPGTVIGMSTRGSAAIFDPQGNIIGALTCGHDLSQTRYIDSVKEQNGCEATFFAGDTRMNTTLMEADGTRVIGTKASDEVIQAVITEKSEFSGRYELFGHMYAVHYSPVIIGGDVIGMLFTGVNIEDALAQESSIITMIIIAMCMLLLSMVIVTLVIRSAMNKSFWYESILDSMPFPISVTDMNMNWTFINKPVEGMLNVKRTDIIGKHCSNWGAGICNTSNCGITCLRGGKNITYFEQMGADFQVNISYLHNSKGKMVGHVEIVQDITKTVETQKAQAVLVDKIFNVSGAFVNASRQIADGAQSLAQGSTEQSASVEQLSATITQVAQKTKSNAEMAERAAHLAGTIKQNAEKGSRQMDEMMTAVREITEASQSINKVIEVIDNIAFQTNILALNAAVEAARAGQHGKGFAVVAEEVRSLAAKSSEAAKDTSALIADSIKKAELGSGIAGNTAESLKEIVSGINESSQLVGDIAASSNEQSTSIQEINKGIEQVAQVVHMNNATAEESASAAEELSGQTAVLEELLTDFRNKASSEGQLGEGEKQLQLPD